MLLPLLLLLTSCEGGRSAGPIDVAAARAADGYSVYTLQYALSKGVKKARLVAGAPEPERTGMAWQFHVALGHGAIVLIDAGTDRLARREDRQREDWQVVEARGVLDGLDALGIAAGDVSDVLLTHHHWDHADGLKHFDKAKVHVHARAWDELQKQRAQLADRVAREARLRLFSGARHEALPGIEARLAGQHTPGHSVYLLDCLGGSRIAIAGDGAYLYENLERQLPIRQALDRAKNVVDMQALVKELGKGAVIPGHDPAVLSRHPRIAPHIARLCPK